MLLSSMGTIELYSASTFMAMSESLPAHFYVVRQLAGLLGGAILASILARMDYRRLQHAAWPLLGLSVILLVIIVLPGTEAIAPRVNGARRWLKIGFTFQPSELAKISLLIWTAALLVKKQERMHSLRKGLAPFLIIWFGVSVPIMLQPNFSTAMLIVLLTGTVIFAGGARIGHFILIGSLTLPVLFTQMMSAGYRSDRITTYLSGLTGSIDDPTGTGYQIQQALIAVGSGGIFGVGFGQSRQKFGFLPEPHNDFLFAMIGEEWGLIGTVTIITLYVGFTLTGYHIANRATDLFGQLLAIGMTNLITISALLHMGVSLGLLPTTGVMLPFMSYGRSGLLVSFAAVGILLSICKTLPPERDRHRLIEPGPMI